MQNQTIPEGRPLSIPPPFDPRDHHVTERSVADAKRAAAKEALEALCMNFPSAFDVLLHRARLTDRFGSMELDAAFQDLLADRRLR